MSKRSESSQRAKQQRASAAPTSEELAHELAALSRIPDDDIDMTDMPEELDWAAAMVGKYYRPIKKPISLRLDADVLEWLRSTGTGYQSRLNDLARYWMQTCRVQRSSKGKVSARETMRSAARAYTAQNTPKSKSTVAARRRKS